MAGLNLSPPRFQSKWRGKTAHFLGDSITQGAGSSTPSDPNLLYHALVKKQLGLASVSNYGVSGTHISGAYTNTSGNSGTPTQSFTARYSGMSNTADLVVVFGGTNDFGHAETAPIGTFADTTDISFYGALRTLMSGLINKYPTQQIVFMTPLHREADDTANTVTSKKLSDYVAIIKEVAAYYAIPVLDLYSVSGIQPNLPIGKTTYAGDGLHPNAAGHAVIARKLSAFLETL
nr:SGNH/GDSL hydrolase family protein [Mycobacterium sp. E3298]